MNEKNSERRLARRTMLKGLAAAGLGAMVPMRMLGAEKAVAWKEELLRFLQSCAKPDGGYGWPESGRTANETTERGRAVPAPYKDIDSHLTPTFAVIGCYVALQREVPNKAALAEYVRENHPVKRTRPESPLRFFDWQQLQALRWLGAEVASFEAEIRKHQAPLAYPAAYERKQWPIFQMETTAFTCRALLGLGLNDLAPSFIPYLESRRRANGSFNNSPASEGGDGHILNTWWGVQALATLGRGQEKAAETAAWVRACQQPNGGFTYQPKPGLGGVDDVAYTWAAARLLKHFNTAPAERAACIAYLHSLRNEDGGFADKPGWQSNPVACYYAVDALAALGALDEEPKTSVARPPRRTYAPLPKDLKVFTIQLEAPGAGSPAEAVELARALHIEMWGAKNSKPGWIARAQTIADARKVPVTFFVANEEYGTWVTVPGMGTYSHTSDIIAPANAETGEALANTGAVSWEEFRQRRMLPLERGDGRLIWQFGENEELCRLYLDESAERGAYAAISTFHFGNPDFTISQPFLERYRGQLPYIALQDAHGGESWWWGDILEGFRTLFLGTAPTWAEWKRALKNDWVMAVRRDTVTDFKLRMHGGAPGVREIVQAQEAAWQWWDNPQIVRPQVVIVVARPEDEFEVGKPEKGVAIRVRCQWENTKQGQVKTPRTELVSLTVDGKSVSPELVQKKAPRGANFLDVYHRVELPEIQAGRHVVEVKVREIETKKESTQKIEFEV